ncbi:MAG: hypothetical protein II922_09100 [Succinimonas sp.]|nr:hypothetical protein [Succinimonas sp.]
MSNEVGAHTVNKVIYLVLTVCLGPWGVHKFYARRPIAGVLIVLISCSALLLIFPIFISLVWVVISFVKALLTPADSAGNIEA